MNGFEALVWKNQHMELVISVLISDMILYIYVLIWYCNPLLW